MDQDADFSSTQLVISQQSYPIELAISAWLDAKSKLSGSAKTLRAYQDTITGFRQALQRVHLDLDAPARDVALVLQAWASRDTTGQHEVTANTFNQRLAILSSFYAFARKRQLLLVENPVSLVDRRKVYAYAHAVALTPQAVTRALRKINRETLPGKRDYALLAVAFHTGRRVAELAGLRWGHVQIEDNRVTLTFPHAKGGKVMRDTLPGAVGRALLEYLYAAYGDDLSTLASDAPIWLSFSRVVQGTPLTVRSISNLCEKYLGTGKAHVLRHTFARSMEDAGAKVSEIQSRLGHASLATTGRYLAALHSAENTHGEDLARMFGMDE
jgi:integrase